MSSKCKEYRNNGTKNPFGKGSRNHRNLDPYLGKNHTIPRAKRENYHKTVYPSHEKRNRRNG